MSQVRVILKSVFDKDGIKQAEKAFATLGKGIDSAFRVVAVASAAAGAAIGKFGLDSVRAASDLEESTNAVNVAFGAAAKSVLAIGETSAKSLGLAKTEFNEAAVRFSAFADRIVGEGGDVAGFIQDVSQRAADFASVFNIDVSEALRVFQSGLAGEAEPLKRFGINLLQSEVNAFAMANGIGEVGRELTETEKVQARYGLLLQSTNKTAGDFANTSDGLANSQRILKASFTDLQAEVGDALLPVVTDLFAAFAQKLLPKMEELGRFLKSPQGQKAIEDMANAFERFFTFVFDNLDTIADLAVKIALAVTGLKVLKTAIDIANVSMIIFNTTVLKNPFVIAATVILTLAGAIGLLSATAEKADGALEAVNMEAKQLEQDLKNLETSFNNGVISQEDYERQSLAIKNPLEAVRREAHALNNETSLQRFRREIAATSGEANRFNNMLKGIAVPTETITPFEVIDTAPVPFTPSARATGPTAFEETQKIIQDAQKKLRDATKRHNSAIAEARKSYNSTVLGAEKAFSDSLTAATINRDQSLAAALQAHNTNLANIQQDFARRQADIIRTSINRLRDAFASAVRTDVAQLFGTDEVGKSVDGLVKALSDRLTASRALLSNAAALASQGFSQTFIEQVVSSGLETGNELAKAILEANPETQGELQSLFKSLESTSETGMDSLAQTMFEKTGLATTELQRLFSQTQTDLVASLEQAETDYVISQTSILKTFDDAMAAATKTRDEAFAEANSRLKEQLDIAAQAYKDSVTEIKDAFLEQIGALENGLGGLKNVVDGFIAAMDRAISKATGVVNPPSTPSAPTITTMPAPRPATSGPIIQPLPAPTNVRTAPAQNVININVKTDATQSTAMVGKTIAKEVNKFTGGGGGLRGISVIAV
jgi:hypothetical protein